MCGTGACIWYAHMWYLACSHVCARHDLHLMHTAGAPKFKLTSQDSTGGKTTSLTVLTSIKVNRNSIEIRPSISLEMTLNIQEKRLIISKTISHCKK